MRQSASLPRHPGGGRSRTAPAALDDGPWRDSNYSLTALPGGRGELLLHQGFQLIVRQRLQDAAVVASHRLGAYQRVDDRFLRGLDRREEERIHFVVVQHVDMRHGAGGGAASAGWMNADVVGQRGGGGEGDEDVARA